MTETLSPSNLSNVPEYTVSEIAGAVKRMVEDRFGRVRVRGEVSGWKGAHPGSGHAYFRLKDENAVLDAVCWKGTLGKLGCRLEEGLEVIASGRITAYPGKSSYQIVIDTVEPAGVGALMAMLEKRRAQLATEGLFDAGRKKPLPFLPEVIGVVTSPSGAVIRDILHRIQERFPRRVIVWPVAVQGEGAAEQIAEAIKGFNSLNPESRIPTPDVLIVARGGGSLEDLWAFNEEIVVRAAAASRIPLISAVGHETDTTLIDFAADKRAPTPTAAAEMAVPVREELLLALSQLGYRKQQALLRGLTHRAERLRGLGRGLPQPMRLLENAAQRLDGWTERLQGALPTAFTKKEQRLAALRAAFRPQLLLKDVAAHQARGAEYAQRLQTAMQRRIAQREEKLGTLGKLLEALNYKSVLKRGFALVTDAEGKLVPSAALATTKDSLVITFHDGDVKAKPV